MQLIDLMWTQIEHCILKKYNKTIILKKNIFGLFSEKGFNVFPISFIVSISPYELNWDK